MKNNIFINKHETHVFEKNMKHFFFSFLMFLRQRSWLQYVPRTWFTIRDAHMNLQQGGCPPVTYTSWRVGPRDAEGNRDEQRADKSGWGINETKEQVINGAEKRNRAFSARTNRVHVYPPKGEQGVRTRGVVPQTRLRTGGEGFIINKQNESRWENKQSLRPRHTTAQRRRNRASRRSNKK